MNVTIIADASHCADTGAAGYGFWIACERGKAPGGGSMKAKVDGSGAAEMMAVVNAIANALCIGLVERGDRLLLQTDCISAILAFQGARNPTLSQDERRAREVFWGLMKEHDLHHHFRHVKGHTGRGEPRYVTNHLCDKRAKEGMRAARKAIKETENEE